LSTGLVTSLSPVGPGYVGRRYANIRRLSLGALYFPAYDEGRVHSLSFGQTGWVARLLLVLPTVVFSQKTMDARHNPKNKGKKSYQPILTFIAEAREYIGGELHNGDRPSGAQIARHLEAVFAAVPRCVSKIYARADSGFYCGRPWQRMRSERLPSSSWRARPRVCSKV
jgi:hypothetical protein